MYHIRNILTQLGFKIVVEGADIIVATFVAKGEGNVRFVLERVSTGFMATKDTVIGNGLDAKEEHITLRNYSLEDVAIKLLNQ